MLSAADLAAALASRLASVLPEAFSVVSIDDGLRISNENDTAWFGGREFGPTETTVTADLEGFAWNALNNVQDYVVVTLCEAWPKSATGELALPGTRVIGQQLRLWYGPEADPVVTLPPIDITPWQ
jgi:hypothetical protein